MIKSYRLPTLPGVILRTEFLEPLDISQTDFSNHLGGSWTQSKLNAIINGERQLTIDIALDFAEALGTSPQFWMNLQNNYNFALAKKTRKKIRRISIRKKPLTQPRT
jgi:addiction module HigA family antidote